MKKNHDLNRYELMRVISLILIIWGPIIGMTQPIDPEGSEIKKPWIKSLWVNNDIDVYNEDFSENAQIKSEYLDVHPTFWSQGSSNYCRRELSIIFTLGDYLGSAWASAGASPEPMPPVGVSQVTTHLEAARQIIGFLECIPNDAIDLISPVILNLGRVSAGQSALDIENIIKTLQRDIPKGNFRCNPSANPLDLYVGAVHLGAAQGWSSAQRCRPAPMPAIVQTVIRRHLSVVQGSFSSYAPCMPDFNVAEVANINLNTTLSTEVHDRVVGAYTQALWSIGVSDCCCQCSPDGSGEDPITERSLAGQWTYAGTRGKIDAEHDGDWVTMYLTVQPRKAPSPHYVIRARLRGDMLEGSWEFTVTSLEGSDRKFSDLKCRGGKFYGQLSTDKKRITVLPETEDPCNHQWAGTVFYKK